MNAPCFRWLLVASLHERRSSPACSLLADGRVRVAGGSYYDTQTYGVRRAGVELYDPAEDRWTPGDPRDGLGCPAAPRVQLNTSKLAHRRKQATLTRLPSGDVLVTGGFETFSRFDGELDDHSVGAVEVVAFATGELFDGGKLPTATHRHGVVVLRSGAVLVIGGYEGDTRGSTAVQLGVPAGLELAALGPALCARARRAFSEQNVATAEERIAKLREAGRLDEAIAQATKLARSHPDDQDALYCLGLTLIAARRFAEAVEPLKRAVALEPEAAFTLVALGDALFFAGEQREAQPVYQRVLAACAEDSTWTWSAVQRAREQLQFLAHQAGDLEAATQVPADSRSSMEWNNAGTAHTRLGQRERALDAFRRAVDCDARNERAWGNLATTLGVLGRSDEALAAVERTLELCSDPKRRAQALVTRGIAYFELRRFEASVEAYDEAIAAHELPYVATNRGNSLRELGREDEALRSYERSARLGHAPAHWGRACIWVQRGDLARARAAVREAVRLDPSLKAQMKADGELAPLWPPDEKGTKKAPSKTRSKKGALA